MFTYCGNNPLTRIDCDGSKYYEDHPIKLINDTYFQVEYSAIFLDPGVCLFYAYEIIDVYGNGLTLCGMDAERIAKEIYGHALGYHLGEAAKYVGDKQLENNYGNYNDNSGVLLEPIGDFLVERCSTIDVNESDNVKALYGFIWWYKMSGAHKALIHQEYLVYKNASNPRYSSGGPNKLMRY